MSIFLIRHAETASNAERIVQTPEVPLNDRGIAQARSLALRLAEEDIELILSSDHTRAAMTATEIQRATGASVEYDPGLRERNFGEIRGMPYRSLNVDIFAPEYAPPGGETWPEFEQRVDDAWERVALRCAAVARPVAVVTHGLVCRSLAQRRLAFAEPDLAPPRAFSNTSVTRIDADPPWTVRLLNCCRHLDAITAAGRGIAGI